MSRPSWQTKRCKFCFATFLFLSRCSSDHIPRTEEAGNKTRSTTSSNSTSPQDIYFNDLPFPEPTQNIPPSSAAYDLDVAFYPNQASSQKNVEPSQQDSPVNYASNESFFAQLDTFGLRDVADQAQLSNSNTSSSSSQASLTSTVSSDVKKVLNTILNKCTIALDPFKSTNLPAATSEVEQKPTEEKAKFNQSSQIDSGSNSVATCRSQWIAFDDFPEAEGCAPLESKATKNEFGMGRLE